MSVTFDEEKFAALLDLAGQETAVELTQRLEEDLTRVRSLLTDAQGDADVTVLHSQSHVLLSIAGTIGATEVFDLAKRLNVLMRGADAAGHGGMVAELLAQIRPALNSVILRVRSTRTELIKAS